MLFSDHMLKESMDQSGVSDVKPALRALSMITMVLTVLRRESPWECSPSGPEWPLSLMMASSECPQCICFCSSCFTLWFVISSPSSLSQGSSCLIAYWPFSPGTCLWQASCVFVFLPHFWFSFPSSVFFAGLGLCPITPLPTRKGFLHGSSALHIV